MDRHDVEATRIGTFTNSGMCVVRNGGKVVMEMALGFLHDGRPVTEQKSKQEVHSRAKPLVIKERDIAETLLALIARPSVASTAFIAAQYDHEVQETSVTKPLQGRGRVNADAAVMKPLYNSERGLVLAHGYCPWYSTIDTYAMAASAIDTAVRNAVCAGASLDHLAILDNFCWSSSEQPQRLYELKRAAKACFDVAVGYETPFISGKDSMFNDFRGFSEQGNPVHIAALPTLLVSAIGVIPDVRRAMTLDLKRVGDLIYVLGDTNEELGASEYAVWAEASGGNVPEVNTKKNKAIYSALSKAIGKGLLSSAIGVGRGGVGVALAKGAIAGQLGMQVNLTDIPGSAKKPRSILFSESQGRVLVSVRRDAQKEFEKLFKGLSFRHIGEVVQAASLSMTFSDTRVECALSELTEQYRSFFKHW